MRRSKSNGSNIFLMLLGITLGAWIMRGFGFLTFIPGGIIWLLLLATIGTGVVHAVQRSKRW
ncbi:MAG: hypothetical protein WBA57_05450 [Elainellaceae cyanobacterium]